MPITHRKPGWKRQKAQVKPKTTTPTTIPQTYTPAIPTPAPMGISGLINGPQRQQPSLSATNQQTAADWQKAWIADIGSYSPAFAGRPGYHADPPPADFRRTLAEAKTWEYKGPTMEEIKAGPWGQLFGAPSKPPPAPSPGGGGGYYRYPSGGRSTSRRSVSRAISRGLINWRIGL